MAKTAGHSEIPWRTSKHAKTMVETVQGRSVGSMSGYSDNRLPDCGQGENFANVEFIVRACNNHYKLVEALKGLVEVYWMNKGEPFLDPENKRMKLSEFICCITPKGIPNYWKKADEAIKEAEGE